MLCAGPLGERSNLAHTFLTYCEELIKTYIQKYLVQSLVNIKIGKVTKCQSLSLSRFAVRDAQKSLVQFQIPQCMIGLKYTFVWGTAKLTNKIIDLT